jgi:hypothetical protein
MYNRYQTPLDFLQLLQEMASQSNSIHSFAFSSQVVVSSDREGEEDESQDTERPAKQQQNGAIDTGIVRKRTMNEVGCCQLSTINVSRIRTGEVVVVEEDCVGLNGNQRLRNKKIRWKVKRKRNES